MPLLAAVVLLAVVFTAVRSCGESSAGGPQQTLRPGPQQTVPQTGQTEPGVSETVPTLPDQTEEPDQTEPTDPPDETLPEQTEPAQTDPPDVFEDPDPPAPTQPVQVEGEKDLQIRQIARFSGQYVEDGRDELVKNVAAILVTNRSDQFLDLATLTYDVDGMEATFVVTGLPAGTSAWVMEAQRMVIPDDASFEPLECVTSFRDDVTVDLDSVSIYADANMLMAVNNTDRTLEHVFVYYKNLHTDGNFFGGITYRVDFGTLEPGASAEVLAGHYSVEHSELVRIGWVDQ